MIATRQNPWLTWFFAILVSLMLHTIFFNVVSFHDFSLTPSLSVRLLMDEEKPVDVPREDIPKPKPPTPNVTKEPLVEKSLIKESPAIAPKVAETPPIILPKETPPPTQEKAIVQKSLDYIRQMPLTEKKGFYESMISKNAVLDLKNISTQTATPEMYETNYGTRRIEIAKLPFGKALCLEIYPADEFSGLPERSLMGVC